MMSTQRTKFYVYSLALLLGSVLFLVLPSFSSAEPVSSDLTELQGEIHSVHLLPDYYILAVSVKSKTEKILVLLTRFPGANQEASYVELLGKPIHIRGKWESATRPEDREDLSDLYEGLWYALYQQRKVSLLERPEQISYIVGFKISIAEPK